jgi:hypothetical protein
MHGTMKLKLLITVSLTKADDSRGRRMHGHELHTEFVSETPKDHLEDLAVQLRTILTAT